MNLNTKNVTVGASALLACCCANVNAQEKAQPLRQAPAVAKAMADGQDRPNVLFISVDDLNHWIEPLGRNPQAKTPNIQRLADMGVTFMNAQCAVPACNPSRAAIMSGRRPWVTGLYVNKTGEWKDFQKPGEGLTAQFLKAGYHVAGAGKIYHSMKYYPEEWSEYMNSRDYSLHGPGVNVLDGYSNDVVHPDLKDEDIIDWHSVDYIAERLQRDDDQPFFLACGIYKPHLAVVAPRKYYEPFPLESIKRPPTKEGDVDDLPPAARKYLSTKSHKKMLENKQWERAIQSYLATMLYADMNIGRLLDALEKSPHKDNTIIVLWSDHGWSLGEKNRWQKFALWEEPVRSPLIWVVPGMTQPGTKSNKPVDLMSLYPTLCSLAGIEKPEHVSGHDITPLLKNPKADWAYPAITTYGRGNHAIRTEEYRYIRYDNGDEELYHNAKDPYEWTNQANNPEYDTLKKKLASWLPKEEVEQVKNAKGKSGKKSKKKK